MGQVNKPGQLPEGPTHVPLESLKYAAQGSLRNDP